MTKAFRACQIRIRHEGRCLQEEQQLWRERINNPGANTCSSEKIILASREGQLDIFSFFPVCDLARKTETQGMTRAFFIRRDGSWLQVLMPELPMAGVHLPLLNPTQLRCFQKTSVKREGNWRFHILVNQFRSKCFCFFFFFFS